MLIMKNEIVFFDFDGTITSKDTLIPFVYNAIGAKGIILFLLIVPALVLSKVGIVDVGRLKMFFLSLCFKGLSKTDLNRFALQYKKSAFPAAFNKKALEKVREHLDDGSEVVVVTASPSFYVSKIVKDIGISRVIGTELTFDHHDLFTGSFNGENCNYHEKARRIKKCYNLANYSSSFAYGNSKGDYEMLRLVKNSFIWKGGKWLKFF